jgi:molybdopterin converting factor small subunit
MPSEQARQGVTVRYWAGARAAAGVDEDVVEDVPTVGAALARAVALRPALEPVARVSTLLLDGRAASADEALQPGSTVEVLPPFAGG